MSSACAGALRPRRSRSHHTMHFLSLTTALAAVPLVLGASSAPAQLRLSPSPATTGSRVTLAAPEANAVLAHHLGVSSYEHMPLSNNHDWQQALGDSDSSTVGQKIVVVLECPRQGCDGQCARVSCVAVHD